MNERLLTAAGLGAVTGLRSMQGAAWASRELSSRRLGFGASRLQRFLADDAVSTALAGLALGELIADKLPRVPARITPGPLLGRAAFGAVVGAAAGGRGRALAGAAAGAGAAILASYLGWLLRGEVARATLLPDTVVAVAEDAVAVYGARRLAARI